MGPPPVWTQRPSGVLELENDWADYPHRILTGSALGDSHGGQPIITYGRDLGQIAGRFVHEWIVMKLPSNEILFRARQPGGDSASCVLYPSALGQGSVLYHAFETVSGIAPRQWVLAGGPAEDAVPDFIYGATDASNGVEFVLGRGIALSATHVCFMVPTDDSSEITR